MGIGENVGENVAENTGVAGSTSFLAPPTGFTIDSVTTTTMSVSWTAPSKGGATSYKVVNTSTSAVVATTAWGDTDAIIYGLDLDTFYTFHVVTSDGIAQSTASNTDTDTTSVPVNYLYENDMVDETAAGVRMVTYTTPAQTASMHPNWWGTDPAIEYLLLPQSTEYNTGSYIEAPDYWSLSTNPTIHFRMLVELGPGYWEAHASHSKLGKFIWVGNAGDGGNPQCWLKGVVDNENILNHGSDHIYYTALAVGSNGGFPIGTEHGDTYPDNNPQDWYDANPGEIHSFRADEYEGQQICFEVEATLGGMVHVYISTRDGVFTDAAPYASCAADAGVGHLPWTVMQPFVLMRDCANAISTSWVRFGQFVISESKIGTPSGFYL